jgi:serine/threonine protein kinase
MPRASDIPGSVGLQAGEYVDRYRIVGPLGAGGMGEVYQAFDTLLQRDVALKILHADIEGSAGSAGSAGSRGSSGSARILREARAAAALEHPNVVHVYDVGEVREHPTIKGAAYLAMEMIQGKSLRAYIGEASVAMPLRVRWLRDVANALAAAHERGLIHRDIKPENVMIRRDGVVKVLDFGIAKRSSGAVDWAQSTEAHVLSSLSQAGGIAIGTPYYMSPEQMRGDTIDARADQFSWGVLAYELLVGKGPWRMEGGDALKLVAQVLSRMPPAPHAEDAAVPPAVSDAILRTLAKAREDRFATTELLLAALWPEVVDSTMPRVSAPPTSKGSDADAIAKTVSALPLSAPQAVPSVKEERDEQVTKRSKPPPPAPARTLGRWPALMIGGVVVAGVIAVAMRGRMNGAATAPQGSTSAVAARAGCTSNAECRSAHEGRAFVCHRDDGTCAALESEDCEVHADKRALEAEDTVWIGTMFPLKGPRAEAFGSKESESVELGRRDFAEVLGGIGVASGAAHVRPIGLVTCDDSVDAARAARHLADEARVPAVIGFGRNAEAVQLAESAFLPKRVLVLSSVNASPMITAIPSPAGEPRLVWRSMYSATQSARPLAAFVRATLEPRVGRATGRAAGPLRLALLRLKTMSQLGFADALQRALVFNGKSALLNGTNFLDVIVDDPFADGARPDFEAAITSLLSFAPDIVVLGSWEALTKGVVIPLEERWPRAVARPTYAGQDPLQADLFPFLGKSADRRHRFFGLTSVSTTPNNARLVAHFNETFPDKVTRTATPNGSYDAFYVLAYASLAVGEARVTGPSLSIAFKRLEPPGRPLDVGPLAILDGYGALARGENVDLDGALGHLDFDPATGEAPVDMAILCADVDRHGVAFDGIESGVIYDARESVLKGALSCP